MHWWQADPIVQRVSADISVVREDLLDGGSKIRFLPFLVGSAKEIVFGGPFCGGAPYALSVFGRRMGVKVTLFYAKRKQLHPRQEACRRNGAKLVEVPFGYMSNVQAKAKAYAKEAGALFLPLGFDVMDATEPFVEAMRGVRRKQGSPDQVWCATGSGMLARCLGQAFPESEIVGVIVGLKSRNEKQQFGENVRLLEAPYDFAKECRAVAPFSCCPNYDRKAWEMCARMHQGTALFWNVLGEHKRENAR